MDEFLLFVAVGFAAQLVDGAIGMGHGLIGMTILLSFGLPPATASASVHAAEVFTTAASGISHAFFGNVDRSLAVKLPAYGVIGGIIGAYVLVHAPHDPILIVVSIYLFAMGGVIFSKAFRRRTGAAPRVQQTAASGLCGGILGAMGGGGWGPNRRGGRPAPLTQVNAPAAHGGLSEHTFGTDNPAWRANARRLR